jgi:hypothetical protein
MTLKSMAAAGLMATVVTGTAPSGVCAGLIEAGRSDVMFWNGVAVDHGRVFVSGPRWAGGTGPALAILGKDGLSAYPDASWNAWKPGADPTTAFVNVNAIHLDNEGALWVIDTGTPEFGGDPLPGAPKAVKINLTTNRIERIYRLDSIVRGASYIDDIRTNGKHAYLTDAGKTPAIVVLDLVSGKSRRVLEETSAVKAAPGRPIMVGGKQVMTSEGPLVVNADPLEVSPDGKWFYFGPMSGPWHRIETRLLDDPSQSKQALSDALQLWADLPPIGGAVMDTDGSLFFSELATDTLKRRGADGSVTTIVSDARLHWVDAPFIDSQHAIWLPVPQLDRAPPFNEGISRAAKPVMLYRYQLPDTH